MSYDATSSRIKNNPKYNELVHKRSVFAWSLSALVLFMYCGFIMLIAFEPQFLATPIAEGRTITIGLPIGAGVILIAILTAGIYVRRANKEFDVLIKQLIEGSK